MRPGQSILTGDEINRALFVDYEGSKNRPPTLLGYMIDNKIGAAIVEPSFYDCRERYKAKHAVIADHTTIAKELNSSGGERRSSNYFLERTRLHADDCSLEQLCG
jgi:hypothetical protein